MKSRELTSNSVFKKVAKVDYLKTQGLKFTRNVLHTIEAGDFTVKFLSSVDNQFTWQFETKPFLAKGRPLLYNFYIYTF